MSKIPGHRYSTKSSKSDRSRGSTTTLITLATVAIGASGVLYYAKHDPEVRATLEGWIPGTDKAIQIIFQEKSTYFEFIRTCFETLQQTLISALFGEKSQEESGQKKLNCVNSEDYMPPKPAFVPLVDKKEPPINDPYTEIRVSKEKGEEIEIVAEKPSPPAKDVPKELMPKNLVELETSCGETASKAIAAYQKAACAIQDYNQDVIKVVESANVTVGSTVWNRLKDATEKRKEAIKEAEEHANVALNSLRKMYDLMDDPKFEAPSHMKTAARRNIKKILDDVDVAKKKYELEVESGNMAERYWKQVKEARENFNEELQILFPDINIQKKKLAIDENAFDLFVLHMYNKVNRLQKELEKLKTINGSKLKAALKSSGDVATEEQLNTLVCMELDSEKLILEDQFNKKETGSFEDDENDAVIVALCALEQTGRPRALNRAPLGLVWLLLTESRWVNGKSMTPVARLRGTLIPRVDQASQSKDLAALAITSNALPLSCLMFANVSDEMERVSVGVRASVCRARQAESESGERTKKARGLEQTELGSLVNKGAEPSAADN
ncbi:Putative mitochondrial inner membrane protein [Eufriesea mexicana]|uniref:MICOS complex subunit MIC60 n=1 Tax=Eufriesea mexicana TaxID=516756 RepID=A0A310SRA5_9HYME|nr:Putative mitochondrial inner membrane protein [Eufriesea mexicana]